MDDHDGLIYVADYGSPMNILSNVFNLGHYFYETLAPIKLVPKEEVGDKIL